MNTTATDIDVLRVFCAGDGRYGNPSESYGTPVPTPTSLSRQALAKELGFSETVFVDDPERGLVDIYTPGLRLPLRRAPASSARLWLLDLEVVHPPAGEVWVRGDGEFTWIEARAEWAPPRTLRRYASAAEVEALEVPEPGDWIYAWAWEEEAAAGSGRGPSRGAATASTRTRRPARRRCSSRRSWDGP